MPGRIVALVGPSAAGKTRAVGAVARQLGGAPIAEAYDRLDRRTPLQWTTPAQLLRVERTLLTEEARRYREARDLAEAGPIVLTDTGFLGPLFYTWGLVRLGVAPRTVLDSLLRTAHDLGAQRRWGLPDGGLYLQTPASERARRARRDPVDHPAAVQARHQEVATLELRLFRELIAPAFGSRFRFVSGTGSPREVTARLARAAVQVAASRARVPALASILAALGRAEGVP